MSKKIDAKAFVTIDVLHTSLIVTAVSVLFFLTGCGKKQPLLLIRISDTSASALNNPVQVQLAKDTCYGSADAGTTGDLHASIQVNQEVIGTDPELIEDRGKLYGACKKKLSPKGSRTGTYVCPALELARDMSDRTPNHPPVVILQIETNEQEKFCPSILKQLADNIASRQGQLLIVGSTNDGNTGFNSQLWQTLKAWPKTKFCSQNARICVQESIEAVRNRS